MTASNDKGRRVQANQTSATNRSAGIKLYKRNVSVTEADFEFLRAKGELILNTTFCHYEGQLFHVLHSHTSNVDIINKTIINLVC